MNTNEELTEVPDAELSYHTSQMSQNGTGCVEVAHQDGLVYVRNSRKPQEGRIVYTAYEWECLIDGVRNNEPSIVGPNL